MLDKKCGTLPYCPPEVLIKPYFAQPADIWSCGVILVTMLAGGNEFSLSHLNSLRNGTEIFTQFPRVVLHFLLYFIFYFVLFENLLALLCSLLSNFECCIYFFAPHF
jgi:serine/threonine protein kinase